MQALITKFHGPTSTKGSRISAKCHRMTIYVSWDSALTTEANHVAAANELKARMAAQCGDHWNAPTVAGFLPDGNTYAHVYV